TLPVNNLDTFDPQREQIYSAYNFEFRFRPGRGAQLFGGIAVERQLEADCTSPDNPNAIRFCDDRNNSIPFSRNVKLPGSLPLKRGVQSSAAFVERITQLDFKVSKNFKVGRATISPSLELFNINSSDAIISYVSTNMLSASYEKPNSIMQPRMIGIGVQTRW